jgi:ATP-dependent DNA helicase DinG
VSDGTTGAVAVRDWLSHGSALTKKLPAFAEREGQLSMAQDIAELVIRGGTLACEAGTGTGKTLAYLVPLLSVGRRAIISTGTKNLQDQLFFRDLPLVSQAMGARVTTALLKGRSNYLCLHRMHAFNEAGQFTDRQIPAHLVSIRAWAAQTVSGDIAELDSVPEDAMAWRFATSTRDNCLGACCAWADKCHLFEARRKASQADVIVVNHHLLLAQLSMQDGGDLLPAVPVLVVDEAHQLPDLATEFFGITLSSGQLLELVRDAQVARRVEAPDMAQLSSLLESLERSTRDLLLHLEPEARRVACAQLRHRVEFDARVAAVADALDNMVQAFALVAERGRALAACEQRAESLAATLKSLRENDDQTALSWLDQGRRNFTWRASPLDVGSILGPRLQSRHLTLLLTSATLAVADDLSHFSDRMGVTECAQQIYPSPFDYPSQALLYLPKPMLEPREPGYAQRLHECIRSVLELSRGRAFVLFTSHAALQLAHDVLRAQLSYPLLVQGEAPRGQLLERFRDAGNAVLFGTYSFWEGVDVRGEALSCVIIDKLPFAPPDDPLLRARHAALREQGLDPFNHQQLPHAAIALKQGVGRLIRDAADRGVVAICDPRLYRKGYGARLLNSLPPMRRTQDIEAVRAFFREAPAHTGDSQPPPC